MFTIPSPETDKDKAVSASGGIKLSLKDMELRAYSTLPKTGFQEIQEAGSWKKRIDLLNETRYGAGIFLYRETFPVQIKAGMNSFSGAVSRLKNPAPSATANPLKKSLSFSSGINAYLPTLNSSVQPKSVFVSAEFPFASSTGSLKVQTFVTEDDNAAVSITGETKLSKISFVQGGFTAARFLVQNDSSVLAKNNCAFDARWLYAGISEFSFKSPFAKLNLYAALHQSPFESAGFWFKIDGRTAFRNFLLDLSYFAVPTSRNAPNAAPLIGCSSSICRVLEQFSVNPQMALLFSDRRNSSIRIGFCALNSWKITSTSQVRELQLLKMSGGISFENQNFTGKLVFSADNLLLSGEPPSVSSRLEKSYGSKMYLSGSQSNFSFSVNADYEFFPPVSENSARKDSVALSASLSPGKAKVFTANSSLNLTFKEGIRSAGNFEAGGTAKFKSQKIRSSFKISVGVPF